MFKCFSHSCLRSYVGAFIVIILSRKDLTRDQREYKKKKAQKKAQRFKQMDDEREQDKNKWIQFNAKVLINCLSRVQFSKSYVRFFLT